MISFNTLAAAAGTSQNSQAGGLFSIGMLIVLFVVMYFIMIRPQKKQQKKEQEMRGNIQIGDEVTTIGGIVGKVVTIKEDTLIIETGADRNKFKVKRWAIQSNESNHPKAE